jgi:hypothetical protein
MSWTCSGCPSSKHGDSMKGKAEEKGKGWEEKGREDCFFIVLRY